MDVFAEIADERRAVADLLAGLSAEQLAAPSLCAGWRVHDVAAHLVLPLEVGVPTFLATVLVCRGDVDRANDRLTRRQARRPVDEIVDVLRRGAGSRFTPPGAGPEAPLTDLIVHGLDIRWPLGLSRDVPEERLRASLDFLVGRSARGIVARGRVDGLRFAADDLDWAHGDGPEVAGPADALALAVAGRGAALDALRGDGLPVLRARAA
ncbi:maleylpyruvate isomerase family mycothiol-dependent enzyme [Vallicoccus soli]|uniref:Maleylpyruvate isomerase family mycothiol-dependent enzyme n=1 Tax=Vallicoccus soli TaxID=2339232 RepID=A0A3A3ZLA1_9ACTN|nr:maleylpyruvate isomerase family mycothiol-dependent enzyme [Vallicoccus soli]RJK96946.1 maleylpyruvate isomerase family mycothiol-dependent enzyme [Vallicoccus soli]